MELQGFPFCATPSCVLHVCSGDIGVHGDGNWAHLGDALIFGRTMIDGVMFCDACARTKLSGNTPEGVQRD